MKKTVFKKILSAAMAVTLTAAMLVGCGGSTGSSGGAKILYIASEIDTFGEVLASAMSEHASSEGVTVDVLENPTTQEQIDSITSASSKGYDAIILQIVDSSTILHTEVAAGDLPIVYVNRKPNAEHLVADKYVYVGSESIDAGIQQGEAILNKLGNPSSLNIVILEGQPGYDALNRTNGVKRVMKEHGVNANYVFDDTANWSTEKAKETMDIFLKTGQPFDCVFSNNDSMAMGVIQSLREHHINPADVPIAGVDGTAEACDAIIAGDMVFSSYQNAKAQAEYAIKAAKLLANGSSISSLEGVTDDNTCVVIPYEPIDSTNVNKYK